MDRFIRWAAGGGYVEVFAADVPALAIVGVALALTWVSWATGKLIERRP